MKAGDIVTVTDGSWSQQVVNGKLKTAHPSRPAIQGQHWTVVKTDCRFPIVGCDRLNEQPECYRNDTIIQNGDGDGDGDGDVVFIHGRFLKLVDPPHVWKHGDVMVEQNGSYPKVYIHIFNEKPKVIHLSESCTGNGMALPAYGKLHNYFASDPIFLFNIKDKL